MTNQIEALMPEMARESANILIIVAARLVRRECLTPLQALSELNQKTISTRALRDAIDRVEESLLREAGKIRDGHDRLARKLRESEAALEQSSNALLDAGKRIAELEAGKLAVKLPIPCMGVVQSGKVVMIPAEDSHWLKKTAVIEAIRAAGGTVKGDE